MAVASRKPRAAVPEIKTAEKPPTKPLHETKAAIPKVNGAVKASKAAKDAKAIKTAGPKAGGGVKTIRSTKDPKAINDATRIRKGLGVTREVFARMTGFSPRAIAGWENGRTIGGPGLRRLKEMDRLRAALAEVMQPEFIPQWLTTPSQYLGELKPVEVLERGEMDRLWRAVLLLGSGMPL